MTARLEVSGASPAARRLISERTRQNANMSHVTSNAPAMTPKAMRAIFGADIDEILVGSASRTIRTRRDW
jgi:hypothetical protein